MNTNEEFISMAKAMKIAKRAPYWVVRQAMLGNIRTHVEMGSPVRYSRADVEALAAMQRQPVTAA